MGDSISHFVGRSVGHTFVCQSHFCLSVKFFSVGHTFICQSHFCLSVTLFSVGHIFVCRSHFCLSVTLLSVSHTFVLGWVEGPPFFFLLSYGCHKAAKHLWLTQRA